MLKSNLIKKISQKLAISMLSAVTLLSVGTLSMNANASRIHRHHRVRMTRMTKRNYRWYKRKKQTKITEHSKKGKKQINFTTNSNSQSSLTVGDYTVTTKNPKMQKMLKIANTKLGDPYVWGGNGPHVFDCSGFTKYLYKHGAHMNIPRTAGAQFEAGKAESERHAKPGDLVFFGRSKRHITHVGMYLGDDDMIDAQNSGVMTEKIHEPWWHCVGFARMM